MKQAFYFERDELGEMGKEAWRVFQRYVKQPNQTRYQKYKNVNPVDASGNFAAKVPKGFTTEIPSLDPTCETTMYNKVLLP